MRVLGVLHSQGMDADQLLIEIGTGARSVMDFVYVYPEPLSDMERLAVRVPITGSIEETMEGLYGIARKMGRVFARRAANEGCHVAQFSDARWEEIELETERYHGPGVEISVMARLHNEWGRGS